MTITEFLNARLDEDEVVAKRAAECEKLRLIGEDRGLAPGDWSWLAHYGQPQPGDIALIDHQVRFDPARVLREVEAKRAILDEAQRAMASIPFGHRYDFIVMMLRARAAVYSGHPDYQQEW